MSATLGWPQVALRLTAAIAVGLVFGIDRGERRQAAGLRTTLLVCLAATLAMMEAHALLISFVATTNPIFRLDVMRLPLGILTGMGFIGAGAVARRGDIIHGVTTAAVLWLVTVIGLCLGAGQFGLGAAGTGVGIAALVLLRRVEPIIPGRSRGTLEVLSGEPGLPEGELRQLLKAAGFVVGVWHLRLRPDERRVTCELTFRTNRANPRSFAETLIRRPGIREVGWQDEGAPK